MRKHILMNEIKILIMIKCKILQIQPQFLGTYCGNVGYRNMIGNFEYSLMSHSNHSYFAVHYCK